MVSISSADPAVQTYIFYSAILAIKMFLLSFWTSRTRFRKRVFANEEDVPTNKGKVRFDDPDVERVRRAHLNDLENIPAFWVLGALYLTTGPSAYLASMLFRVYAAGRIVHTIVYALKPLPQPARFISFIVPLFINAYMAFTILKTYLSAY